MLSDTQLPRTAATAASAADPPAASMSRPNAAVAGCPAAMPATMSPGASPYCRAPRRGRSVLRAVHGAAVLHDSGKPAGLPAKPLRVLPGPRLGAGAAVADRR